MKFVNGVVLGALLAAPMFAMAQDEAAAVEDPAVKWEKNLSVGATYKSGNTEKSLYTLNLKGDRYSDEYDILNSLYAEYGQSGTPTAAKEQTEGQVRGQSEYRHKFGESKFFAGVFGELYNDAIKRIRFRGKIGPNIGYYFIDQENMKLDASFGVNYVYERTANSEGDYGEYRAALNYLWNFSETSSYYLNIEYSANMENVDTDNNGLLVTGVRSQVYEALSLFAELRDEYDNLPDTAGLERNDLTITAGLSYDF
ncbi:DUF481 domain-containing protein [Pontiellaceae bacterium B12227]|nr:DUF481 domain-containing protein [Pontiellaceae bacterium B12227]